MRIAYVIPKFDPSHGGMQRDAYDSACGLVSEGAEVRIFTRFAPPSETFLPPQLSISLIKTRANNRRQRLELFAAQAKKSLSEQGPWDIVEGFCRTSVGNVYRAGTGTHHNYCRTVYPYKSAAEKIWSFLDPKNNYYVQVEKRNFLRPNLLLIANSLRTKREILSLHPSVEGNIEVIYPSVDLTAFNAAQKSKLKREARHDFNLPNAQLTLCFIGTGFFRKGLRYALQIIRTLREQKISPLLLVAGEGKTLAYQKLAQSLGILDCVFFLGHQKNIVRVLAASDALILPSLYEPFGLTPLEAMACGLPVIVSKNCGISEILQNGKEGLILNAPEDTYSAVAFLKEIALNPEKQQTLGKAAQVTAQTLGRERYTKELLNAYTRKANAIWWNSNTDRDKLFSVGT